MDREGFLQLGDYMDLAVAEIHKQMKRQKREKSVKERAREKGERERERERKRKKEREREDIWCVITVYDHDYGHTCNMLHEK